MRLENSLRPDEAINSKGMVMTMARLILTLCSLTCIICSGCQQARTPNKYLIPQGYVGWVCVEYSVKGAPTLPSVSGYNVIRVPMNGDLKTSSIPQSGSAIDEF